MFLVESWRRPAGVTFNLGHYSRDEFVYDEIIEVVIESHVFTPGPVEGCRVFLVES